MLNPKQLHLISVLLGIFHIFRLGEDIVYLQVCMLSPAISAALIHYLTFVSLRKDKNHHNKCGFFVSWVVEQYRDKVGQSACNIKFQACKPEQYFGLLHKSRNKI